MASDDDSEQFLGKLRKRLDRVGIELPKIEVRYNHLSVKAEVHQGSRAIPSLPNFFLTIIEWPWCLLGFTKKLETNILSDVSGILKPSRLTLLLGPPESGRTTLLRAMAGRLGTDLQVSGEITYNGHQMNEFVSQKTSAYISQYDLQLAELTITALMGRSTNLLIDYTMKTMGLDVCAGTLIGDAMRRGISGGQKKRVTTAEMLVGPSKAFFMDEISTGLDSSTTFQIMEMLQQIAHAMDSTMVISLLQPPPETYALFDELILISEGQIVYQGPCGSVLEFMAHMGFRCPERKAIADFLQEVTSRKDQRQYWANSTLRYQFVPVSKFVEGFKTFYVGQGLASELAVPYDKSKCHPEALVHKKYSFSTRELFKACFARELILMKRNLPTYQAKIVQIRIVALISGTLFLRTTLHHDTTNDAMVYMGALFFAVVSILMAGIAELTFTTLRLPVFYKEKELFLYPAWAMSLPMFLPRIPWSILEAGVYVTIVYFITGFSPEPGRFFTLFLALVLVNQATIGMFRLAAAVARVRVVAENLGTVLITSSLMLGGFVLSKDNMPVWWKWASWCSGAFYGQQAASVNEFLSKEWDKPYGNTTLGVAALKSRGLETQGYWASISLAALLGFVISNHVLFTLALQFIDPAPVVRSSAMISQEASLDLSDKTSLQIRDPGISSKRNSVSPRRLKKKDFDNDTDDYDGVREGKKGMVLPFQPLSISFENIYYYIDMPNTMKEQVKTGEERLQLLSNVSGAFRPGVLTALVGVSGAGKTTLMDVLAGRKTIGYMDGDIFISGYQKKQSTFTRVAGYCEQNDIHSPNVTVFESLIFSAWMRLSPEVDKQTRTIFVEEVMSLVELEITRDFVVGLPGQSGLSTGQRKRLTMAVELVANPSIIFMDEPTSGLDARAAAIVMRAVRNIGDTGRTIVCTIHQPSIDIFEAFDELLLLTVGGKTIYGGPLGQRSRHLVDYFEDIPLVPKLKEGYNPATWMLEVSTKAMESKLGVDFAEIYAKSPACEGTQQDVFNLMGAFVSSTMFLGFSFVMAVQPVVASERIVYYRERGARLYSPLTYAVAQCLIEWPYVLLNSILFTFVVYPMIQLEWQYAKVLWFLFFVFFFPLFFVHWGMISVAATPNPQAAAIFATSVVSILLLFSGIPISRKQMPLWWRWLYWGDPIAWSIYGLTVSQLGDVETFLILSDDPGKHITVKAYISSYFGFEHSFLKYMALEQVALIMTLTFVFALCIKYCNFHRR